MATEINIGSGNGLLPDGTTWTNVDWSSVKSSDIHIRTISQEMPQPSITKIRLNIAYLKFHSNFPGANELIDSVTSVLEIIYAVYSGGSLVSAMWNLKVNTYIH